MHTIKVFSVVQRGCNIYGARNHNANPLKIATGLDLLQTPRSEQWSRKTYCNILYSILLVLHSYTVAFINSS